MCADKRATQASQAGVEQPGSWVKFQCLCDYPLFKVAMHGAMHVERLSCMISNVVDPPNTSHSPRADSVVDDDDDLEDIIDDQDAPPSFNLLPDCLPPVRQLKLQRQTIIECSDDETPAFLETGQSVG